MRIDLPGCNFKNCCFSYDGNCTNKIEYDRCEYRIAKCDLAEAEPVRHGKWIYHPDDLFPCESKQECSICHSKELFTLDNENYCPNCGAKMDGSTKTKGV